MKKIIKGMLAFVLLTSLSVTGVDFHPDKAEAASYQSGVVKVSGNLNVRSGPSSKYPIIGKLKDKASVTIYATQGSYYRIGVSQFVSKEFVVLKSSKQGEKSIGFGKVKVSSGSLNVRSGASSSSPVIGKISNGTVVLIYEKKNGFVRIEKGRWVSSTYIK